MVIVRYADGPLSVICIIDYYDNTQTRKPALWEVQVAKGMSHLNRPPPEWLTASYMEQHLKEALQDSELTVNSIKVERGSAAGEGYICQILRVILGITKISKESATLYLISKLEPIYPRSDKTTELTMYDIEKFFFTTILPKFKEYIEAVPDVPTFLPKFYFSDDERRALFMEDLKASDFSMQPRRKYLTLEQSTLGVEAIATFHGASLHFLEEQPEIKEKCSYCPWAGDLPLPYVMLIKNGVKSLEMHVQSYGLPENYVRRLLEIQKDIDAGKLKVCVPKLGEINVLNHGDLNKNNFMHHFQNGVADDIRLIDFQALSYNNFAQDLQYFLFFNVTSDVLVTKLDYLLEKYYKRIKLIAPEAACPSFEQVKKEFADRYFFGYFLSVLFRPFVTAEIPVDMQRIMKQDGVQDNGFDDGTYIDDLRKLLPFFEKVGVL